MDKQFTLNGSAIVAGITGLIWSRTFTGSPLEWVGFGIAAGLVLLSAVGLRGERSRTYGTLYALLGLVSLWTVVASLVFGGATLGWLLFAGFVATAAINAVALEIHELTTEHVVHTLEVRDESDAQTEYRTAA